MSDRQRQRHARKRTEGDRARALGHALAGLYIAPPGSHHEGATNDEALEAIERVLGEPLHHGALYRVSYRVGDKNPTFIGEYVGLGRDMVTGFPEPALGFVIRNPVLPATARQGTLEDPFPLWPLDITAIRLATPSEIAEPMHFDVQGEPPARVPGRSHVQ